MAISEYRAIESADGTFTVELRETTNRGNLLFKKDGFQTRREAEAWYTPVEMDPPWIVRTTTGTQHPVLVIDNTAENSTPAKANPGAVHRN